MCLYSDKQYKHRYVCFECNYAFKSSIADTTNGSLPRRSENDASWYQRGNRHVPYCSKCRTPTYWVGRHFAPPKARDKKAWEILQLLVVEGKITFDDCGCRMGLRRDNPNKVFPTTVREAQALVDERREFYAKRGYMRPW